ncbi:hypothetical protein E4T42_04149 [Aureobasidium subglaciale]|nr:hypothetical protein E4T42_04149 [Aureobasidium subglaciale]
MQTPAYILDEFAYFTASERAERMAGTLLQFQTRMSETNGRVLGRVLDMIEASEGDEALHLDMLATHMSKYHSTHLQYSPWKNGYTLLDGTEINSMSAYRAYYSRKNGLLPHSRTNDGLLSDKDASTLLHCLANLQWAVREHADEGWLGETAHTLELPADYCELLKHVRGVGYENWDRQMFIPDIDASVLQRIEDLALEADELSDLDCTADFRLAAGCIMGENEHGSQIIYAVSRHTGVVEPWRWRIFVEANFPHTNVFENVEEFLIWLSSADDWIDWSGVRESVGEVHKICAIRRTEEAEHKETLEQLGNYKLG